jgi:hypothetical protein
VICWVVSRKKRQNALCLARKMTSKSSVRPHVHCVACYRFEVGPVCTAATEEDGSDLFAAYFADASKDRDRDVVFDDYLGLAVEQLRDGWTVEKLWSTM